ncbi:hypothetical protein NDU88_009449 [Pleurodeles waltl]|uniref:Uncharacterized protein n=1 Tax=Pleurodeles waltl TaxID=8319 RepID=A0AAV7QSR1_PLEWA|nr:hypothetical protein NDU88_009449 [Pleurodeles waltl]
MDQYYDDPEKSMEQDLVEALDAREHQSVNKALVRALDPTMQHLFCYPSQKGWIPAPHSLTGDEDHSFRQIKTKGKSAKGPHSGTIEKLARYLSGDHAYSAPPATAYFPSKTLGDSDSSNLDSSEHEEELGPSKRKRKMNHKESLKHPKVLVFEPTEVIHSRSTTWLPPKEVADYVQ